MSFPVELTAALTGASSYQLQRWRSSGLLKPEDGTSPVLYSFRDLVALRTVVRLRSETSLQKIRTAVARLPEYDLTDHMAEYQFATDGKTIAVSTDEGFLDLVKRPGQYHLFSLSKIYEPFTAKSGKEVVDFRRPRQHLQVDARRLGGWPTIEGTRVGYDTIAAVVDGKSITAENVAHFYPGVTQVAAYDAIDFDRYVRQSSSEVA